MECRYLDDGGGWSTTTLGEVDGAEVVRGDVELEDYTEARMLWNANPPTVKTHQLSAACEVID